MVRRPSSAIDQKERSWLKLVVGMEGEKRLRPGCTWQAEPVWGEEGRVKRDSWHFPQGREAGTLQQRGVLEAVRLRDLSEQSGQAGREGAEDHCRPCGGGSRRRWEESQGDGVSESRRMCVSVLRGVIGHADTEMTVMKEAVFTLSSLETVGMPGHTEPLREGPRTVRRQRA